MLLVYDDNDRPYPCDVLVLGAKLQLIDLGNASYKIAVSADITEKESTVTIEKDVVRTVTKEIPITVFGGQQTVSQVRLRTIWKGHQVTKWIGTLTVARVQGKAHVRIVTREKYL